MVLCLYHQFKIVTRKEKTMQNIITVIFENESEGYQLITELRNAPVTEEASILQMALVKCDKSGLELLDRYDGIAASSEGTVLGGLTGALLGVLGGPIGMLLMGTTGALAGTMASTGGAVAGAAMLETVAGKLIEGEPEHELRLTWTRVGSHLPSPPVLSSPVPGPCRSRHPQIPRGEAHRFGHHRPAAQPLFRDGHKPPPCKC